MPLEERLKDERERLGLSQTQFGALASVKKGTVINWEKGSSSPNGVQFEALAKIGLDVTYVITGKSPKTDLPPTLTAEEQLLIESYRSMETGKRKKILQALITGKIPKKKKPETIPGLNFMGETDVKVGQVVKGSSKIKRNKVVMGNEKKT